MKKILRRMFLILCLLMSVQAWASDNKYGLKDSACGCFLSRYRHCQWQEGAHEIMRQTKDLR